jgi:uncharacterized membrane protein YhaH (DUF805 family)
MNFAAAVRSGFNNYVTFSGRASRSEYWYWALFTVIASIAAGIVDGVVGLGVVETVVSLALFLPSLAIAVRRLHDIDRTGWWVLIAFTVIGLIVLIYWDCVKGTEGPNRFGPDPLGLSAGMTAPPLKVGQ